MKRILLFLVLIGVLLGHAKSHAQAVAVTLRLDADSIEVGGTTTLRVYAQVIPSLQPNAEQIFSWYVDVLNTNGAIASAQFGAMQKSTSDNDPQTSSTGFDDGANRRGIYDTFMNLPGAGVSDPVELMSIPVRALAAGRTRFSVRAGTGVPDLSADFIVAPKNGSDPWIGGDYALANVDLFVLPRCSPPLQIHRLDSQSFGGRLRLLFTPCAGRNHTVETHSTLTSAPWQPLPGAPHNSGTLTVTNHQPRQFFRVRVD